MFNRDTTTMERKIKCLKKYEVGETKLTLGFGILPFMIAGIAGTTYYFTIGVKK